MRKSKVPGLSKDVEALLQHVYSTHADALRGRESVKLGLQGLITGAAAEARRLNAARAAAVAAMRAMQAADAARPWLRAPR
jgi:hypothetical protein